MAPRGRGKFAKPSRGGNSQHRGPGQKFRTGRRLMNWVLQQVENTLVAMSNQLTKMETP